MKLIPRWIWVGLLLLCAACTEQPGRSASEAAPEALPVADIETLRNLIQQADRNDRVLVIDFWATWCEPCKVLFPDLHAGLEALEPAVRGITVTLDSPGEFEQQAITYLQQQHALEDAYILTPDADAQLALPAQLGDEWNILAAPAILIFDPNGELAGEFFGADAEPILDRVRELIPGNETAEQRG